MTPSTLLLKPGRGCASGAKMAKGSALCHFLASGEASGERCSLERKEELLLKTRGDLARIDSYTKLSIASLDSPGRIGGLPALGGEALGDPTIGEALGDPTIARAKGGQSQLQTAATRAHERMRSSELKF